MRQDVVFADIQPRQQTFENIRLLGHAILMITRLVAQTVAEHVERDDVIVRGLGGGGEGRLVTRAPAVGRVAGRAVRGSPHR